MKTSKSELLQMNACTLGLKRFVEEINSCALGLKSFVEEINSCALGLKSFVVETKDTNDDPVEVTKLIGGANTIEDLLWLACKKLGEKRVISFTLDCVKELVKQEQNVNYKVVAAINAVDQYLVAETQEQKIVSKALIQSYKQEFTDNRKFPYLKKAKVARLTLQLMRLILVRDSSTAFIAITAGGVYTHSKAYCNDSTLIDKLLFELLDS